MRQMWRTYSFVLDDEEARVSEFLVEKSFSQPLVMSRKRNFEASGHCANRTSVKTA